MDELTRTLFVELVCVKGHIDSGNIKDALSAITGIINFYKKLDEIEANPPVGGIMYEKEAIGISILAIRKIAAAVQRDLDDMESSRELLRARMEAIFAHADRIDEANGGPINES